VRAGERSGNLEEVLQRFLDFQRVSLTFRKKLKASLIYPALLIVMVIALFYLLITFVVRVCATLRPVGDETNPGLTVLSARPWPVRAKGWHLRWHRRYSGRLPAVIRWARRTPARRRSTEYASGPADLR